jgi:hypothetical protein
VEDPVTGPETEIVEDVHDGGNPVLAAVMPLFCALVWLVSLTLPRDQRGPTR